MGEMGCGVGMVGWRGGGVEGRGGGGLDLGCVEVEQDEREVGREALCKNLLGGKHSTKPLGGGVRADLGRRAQSQLSDR